MQTGIAPIHDSDPPSPTQPTTGFITRQAIKNYLLLFFFVSAFFCHPSLLFLLPSPPLHFSPSSIPSTPVSHLTSPKPLPLGHYRLCPRFRHIRLRTLSHLLLQTRYPGRLCREGDSVTQRRQARSAALTRETLVIAREKRKAELPLIIKKVKFVETLKFGKIGKMVMANWTWL